MFSLFFLVLPFLLHLSFPYFFDRQVDNKSVSSSQGLNMHDMRAQLVMLLSQLP